MRKRPVVADPEVRYINREVSWLDFNARILALVEDPDIPILERAKFLAIVSQAMDEFFQVRVAGLKEQIGAGVGTTAPDGMSAAEQLHEIRVRVEKSVARQDRVLTREILPVLREAGVTMVAAADLHGEDAEWLRRLFE